jgi:branched-chain amino acid transport system ATP-binding protein
MASAGLTIDKLCVARGHRRVLHDVSLRVRPGEVVALLGANGAGKSSLVMAVMGAIPVEGGSIHLDDRPYMGLTPDRVRRHGIAVSAEGHRVLGKLTVRENLEVAALQHPLSVARSLLDQSLDLFPELVPHLGMLADNLSGGQKQMVCIAQALAAKPKILLIDELSLGLAPIVINRLVTTLKGIAAQGIGILLVEQFTTLALSMASRVYLLELGHIAFDGPVSDLIENPEILQKSYLAGGRSNAA